MQKNTTRNAIAGTLTSLVAGCGAFIDTGEFPANNPYVGRQMQLSEKDLQDAGEDGKGVFKFYVEAKPGLVPTGTDIDFAEEVEGRPAPLELRMNGTVTTSDNKSYWELVAVDNNVPFQSGEVWTAIINGFTSNALYSQQRELIHITYLKGPSNEVLGELITDLDDRVDDLEDIVSNGLPPLVAGNPLDGAAWKFYDAQNNEVSELKTGQYFARITMDAAKYNQAGGLDKVEGRELGYTGPGNCFTANFGSPTVTTAGNLTTVNVEVYMNRPSDCDVDQRQEYIEMCAVEEDHQVKRAVAVESQ